MSEKVRIELNLAGVNEMMKSPGIQSALQAAGEAVAAAASEMADGEPFEASTHLANWVAITNVWPASKKASKANYNDNVLLKGIGAAGLPTSKGG